MVAQAPADSLVQHINSQAPWHDQVLSSVQDTPKQGGNADDSQTQDHDVESALVVTPPLSPARAPFSPILGQIPKQQEHRRELSTCSLESSSTWGIRQSSALSLENSVESSACCLESSLVWSKCTMSSENGVESGVCCLESSFVQSKCTMSSENRVESGACFFPGK